MSNNEKSKIIEKIKKLLSLATSDNENEAKMAAARASELMVKYNLSCGELTDADYFVDDLGEQFKRDGQESKFVRDIIQKFFFVYVVTNIKRNYGSRICQDRIYGTPENVEIAMYVHDFLTRSFKSLWLDYKRKNQAPASAKSSFYSGLWKGICHQLSESRAKVEQETGLAVSNKGLVDYVNRTLSGVKTRSSTATSRDSQARNAGIAQGKDLRISRGISQRADRGALLLA